MIREITLGNIASYKNASIEIKKNINLFYGLNGTGKTILSNYLKYEKDKQNKSENRFDKKDKYDYNNCSIDGYSETEAKILVYNQEFIKENFYDFDSQSGIFTLSSENREAEEKIKEANQERGKFQADLNEEKVKLENKEEYKQRIENEAKNKIWEIVSNYRENMKASDFFLKSYRNDKGKLFSYILNISKPEVGPDDTIKSLEEKALALTEGQSIGKLDPISSDNLDNLKSIENNLMFQEPIMGNQNSVVKKLIERLGNSDWVHQGLEYIQTETITEYQQCPFCQEKTISQNFIKEIKDYFDETFERKLADLESLKEEYTRIKNNISSSKDKFDENTYIKNITSERKDLNNLYPNLLDQLDKNLI